MFIRFLVVVRRLRTNGYELNWFDRSLCIHASKPRKIAIDDEYMPRRRKMAIFASLNPHISGKGQPPSTKFGKLLEPLSVHFRPKPWCDRLNPVCAIDGQSVRRMRQNWHPGDFLQWIHFCTHFVYYWSSRLLNTALKLCSLVMHNDQFTPTTQLNSTVELSAVGVVGANWP